MTTGSIWKNLALVFVPVMVAASLLQALSGNPDIRSFAFPVNVAVLIVLMGGLFVWNREWGGSRVLAALASGYAAVAAIAMAAVCCLVIAFAPGLEFQRSWIFNAVLLLLGTNMYLAILRYRGTYRIRFYLNHAGLLLMLVALSLGAADMRRMRAAVNIGETVDRAYDGSGRAYSLGYSLTLDSFEVDFYHGNVPEEFRAVVSSGERSRLLKVNHPWRKSWKEDIYLTGYDTAAGAASEYCILEFIVQPWKYAALSGLLMFLAGAVLLLWGGRKRS